MKTVDTVNETLFREYVGRRDTARVQRDAERAASAANRSPDRREPEPPSPQSDDDVSVDRAPVLSHYDEVMNDPPVTTSKANEVRLDPNQVLPYQRYLESYLEQNPNQDWFDPEILQRSHRYSAEERSQNRLQKSETSSNTNTYSTDSFAVLNEDGKLLHLIVGHWWQVVVEERVRRAIDGRVEQIVEQAREQLEVQSEASDPIPPPPPPSQTTMQSVRMHEPIVHDSIEGIPESFVELAIARFLLRAFAGTGVTAFSQRLYTFT